MLCDAQLKEVVRGMGFELAGLHRKDTLTGNLLPGSRNELSPGDVVSPQPAKHGRMSKHHKRQKIKSRTNTGAFQTSGKSHCKHLLNISLHFVT